MFTYREREGTMNQPNPDKLAQQGPSEYDNLSNEDLRKLINDAARLKGRAGNLQPQVRPVAKKVVDLDQYLGGS